MAQYIFTDGYLLINAVNMSAMAKKITLKTSAAEHITTTFGSTYETRIAGMKDYAMDVEFNQDMAATAVDGLLFPLLGSVNTFEVRATSAVASTTNPAYRGSVLINDYKPFDAAVGDLAQTGASWPGSGTLLRQTT